MTTQAEKGRAFAQLHEGPGLFVMPNPWDAGSAKLLEEKGFSALATTSAGAASSMGLADGAVSRELMMEHCRIICAATGLPVNGDLEHCYADTPGEIARTIALAAEAGLAGCSIEDAARGASEPVYELGEAKERVAAAVEAARALPFEFTLTARAENYLFGRPDLADTIARLQAFQEAGAGVLYAPGLPSLDDIKSVLGSIDRPLNVVAGIGPLQFTVSELEALGVRRISLGSSLYKAAVRAVTAAADEIVQKGSFRYTGT